MVFPSLTYADGPYLNIPPTNAFDKIHSDNGTISAVNFSMPLTIHGDNGVSVKSSNKTHTITISSVNQNSTVSTSNVVDIYDTTIGDYTTPSTATASSVCCANTNINATLNNQTSNTGGWSGSVFVEKITGLTVGNKISTVSLNVVTASGNVRVKVYQNDGIGGGPSTLLGESGSIAVSGTGQQNFPLSISATVPASGTVWVGFETDSALLDIKYTPGGSKDSVVHVYGSGPSPFGAITSTANMFWVQITVWQNHIQYPASNTVDGNTATFWESNTEINPWVYVDTGSAQILSAAAMYWNSSSTCNQILIQTSTNAISWNTKRTTNTNLLTNISWNFERYNLDVSTERYVRFYCNDITAKQLSFYELKVLIPSSTNLLLRHGHEFINSTDATLPLNK